MGDVETEPVEMYKSYLITTRAALCSTAKFFTKMSTSQLLL